MYKNPAKSKPMFKLRFWNPVFSLFAWSYFAYKPWLISQRIVFFFTPNQPTVLSAMAYKPNKPKRTGRLHATLVPWHMHAIIEKQNHFLLPYVSLLSPKMKAKFRHTLMSCLICKPKLNFGQLYRSSYESNMQRKRNKEQRREGEKMKGKTNAMLLCLKDAMPKQILVGVRRFLTW